MILSVSRRTDIPCYYSDWFLSRIKEGWLYVQNPMNPRQVSKIVLSHELVDCIVFWTKNPVPMLKRLDELKDYVYYFQFTLTPYGKDIEPYVPHKKEKMIPIFRSLSEKIGKERVVWRYDPILFNDVYTEEYHRKAFAQMAEVLSGYTEKCVISFVDIYAKNKKEMEALQLIEKSEQEIKEFVEFLNDTAKQWGIQVAACAEKQDFSDCGVGRSSCIDRELIERITGSRLKILKDSGQRPECGCVESIEVGTYDTCLNGCRYCYANINRKKAEENYRLYDPMAPILCGNLNPEDKITERKVKSSKEEQLSLLLPDYSITS